MLNKGMAGKKRLFSEEFYDQSIHEHSRGGFPECTSYGLGWWIDTCSDMDRPHPENKNIVEFCMAYIKNSV